MRTRPVPSPAPGLPGHCGPSVTAAVVWACRRGSGPHPTPQQPMVERRAMGTPGKCVNATHPVPPLSQAAVGAPGPHGPPVPGAASTTWTGAAGGTASGTARGWGPAQGWGCRRSPVTQLPAQWQVSGCLGQPGLSALLPAMPAFRPAAEPAPPRLSVVPSARDPTSRPATATPGPAEHSALTPCSTSRRRSAGTVRGDARGSARTWALVWRALRNASLAATALLGSCCRMGPACHPATASATTVATCTSLGTSLHSILATTAPVWPGRWCAAQRPAQCPAPGATGRPGAPAATAVMWG